MTMERRPIHVLLNAAAGAALGGLVATSAVAAEEDAAPSQKSLEACMNEVEAAHQTLKPTVEDEIDNILSDAADMCQAGHEVAAQKLMQIARNLDEVRRSVITEGKNVD